VCVCVILNIWQMELSDMVLRCKVYSTLCEKMDILHQLIVVYLFYLCIAAFNYVFNN